MHKRTLQLKSNIIYSLLFKGLSVLATLCIVPITLNYVDKNQYGVWLVLSSIIGWFSFFDIGLGNGLKTKLTESLTDGELIKARKYISTTYLLMFFISLAISIVFLISQYFIKWSEILNTDILPEETLKKVVFIVFTSFSIQFILNVIVTVAAANQNTIIGAIINFLINSITLLIIYILTLAFVNGTLVDLSLPMALTPVGVLIIANIYLFSTKYKDISPRLTFFDVTLLKEIFGLGWKFFIIQLGLILVYNIDNLIIAQLFGPAEVTTYNVAFRYFSIITMLSGIIMAPLWAAFGEANRIKDYQWIKGTIKKLQFVILILALLSFCMAVFAPWVYKFWVGKEIPIPLLLSIILAVYTVVNAFRTIYIYYMNGVGIITLQVILVGLTGLLNIPLGIFLGKLLGVPGVVLATLILSVISGIIEYIQFRKIISGQATGIWNR
ncbi:lipopolysaccharide biosynthesis protein [Sphingobacterium sp. UDSM-2020]|uniref:lipopolysaccharide biosynthesis protein n=1 Tax=Sphingobacterium sp. UDSM-2020 TaxID=2795738 RepID=UPI0019356E33|nr:oligosaccharide flippase family protein [Sphingobacterium sp. UDSM-2020]QQD15363.1 oligosaccharide flippase family protein [Sphingobacterium sp. UDSM-2020]